MDQIIETFKKTGSLHHAYVIEGGGANELLAFIRDELKFPTRGNPDFRHDTFETMGIDEARTLRDLQLMRPLGGGRKVYVVETGGLTVEAQNSLLKVLEEPTEGTHFFLVVPSVQALLPTLMSRVVHVRNSGGTSDDGAAAEFLSMSAAERAGAIKGFIDDKDKAAAIAFLSALERKLRGRIDLSKAKQSEIFALEEVEKARRYMHDRSPSVKQLLEHVSVIAPKIKRDT